MSITDAASAPPNLYQKPAQFVDGPTRPLAPVRPVLAGSPARDLPAGTIVDLPSVRYSNGQMEMRPADCATAALMGVVQPRAFEAFAALLNDGDWRGLLHAFERSIPQNPEWRLGNTASRPASSSKAPAICWTCGPETHGSGRSCLDRAAQFDQRSVRASDIGHDLAPRLGLRRAELGRARVDRADMRAGHVLRHEGDLHAQRPGRRGSRDHAAFEMQVSQFARGEGQRGFAGFQFAVGIRLMQETARKAKGILEKRSEAGTSGT